MKKPRAVEQAELVVRYRGPILFNDLTLANQVKAANAAMSHGVAQDILSMWAEIDKAVEHKHQWFSTGAMAPGQMRCIECGMWGAQSEPVEQKQASEA